MAATDAAGGGSGTEPYLWVRCECGAGLWKRYADRLEMTLSPRGGEKRTITTPVHGAPGLSVKCEKCGRENVSI